MSSKFSYQMPTRIAYGKDSLEDIDSYIAGRNTLLITSQGFVKRGLVDKIQDNTKHIIHAISDIKSHPEFKDLKNVYAETVKLDFDLIVAVGGGSVMDSAKFISVYNKERDYDFVESLAKGVTPKEKYNLVPMILAPTTAGTGSEITPYSTIWEMDEKKKYSLHLPDLYAELALYDPVLTLSAPKEITIQTSLDTLSHALESIWNKNANELTVYFAVRSAKLVVENIVRLSNNLDNIEYREMQMKACMYAGLAFSNTQTAIAHAISYYITANKGIDHGIACSFTLPILIDNIVGKYSFVDKAIIEIFGELSSTPLREILSKLNISTNFSDYGIDDHEFIELERSLLNNQRAGNSLAHL